LANIFRQPETNPIDFAKWTKHTWSMAYTVHQAKTNFSRLLREAEAGQEVVVMRGHKPVAKIVPMHEPQTEPTPFRLVGAFARQIHWTEDAFDPVSDAELQEWGWEWMLDSRKPPETSGKLQG